MWNFSECVIVIVIGGRNSNWSSQVPGRPGARWSPPTGGALPHRPCHTKKTGTTGCLPVLGLVSASSWVGRPSCQQPTRRHMKTGTCEVLSCIKSWLTAKILHNSKTCDWREGATRGGGSENADRRIDHGTSEPKSVH